MKKLLILTLILISSCQEKSVKNDAPLSGIIDQENEKTIIVEKLAQGYVDGKFEIAEAYFTQDGVHRVNDAEYSTEEIIAGYNFHSVLFDNIKHNDPWVTTMIYNNGQVLQISGLDGQVPLRFLVKSIRFFSTAPGNGTMIR